MKCFRHQERAAIAILIAVGTYLSFDRGKIDYLSFAMGGVFLVMSGLSYKRFRDACLTC